MRRTLGTDHQEHGTLKDDGGCRFADHREERAERDELQNRKPPAKEEGKTLAAKQALLEMRPR
jgi:hypothetical protein